MSGLFKVFSVKSAGYCPLWLYECGLSSFEWGQGWGMPQQMGGHIPSGSKPKIGLLPSSWRVGTWLMLANKIGSPRTPNQQWVGSEGCWRIYSGSSSSNEIQSPILGVAEVDGSDVLCPFLTAVMQWRCHLYLSRHFLCCGFGRRWFCPFSEPTDSENSLVSFP